MSEGQSEVTRLRLALDAIGSITEPLALLLAIGGAKDAADLLPMVQRINRIWRDAQSEATARATLDAAIVDRVDHWFGGGLCIAFKSHREGRPNEPMTYLYRSQVLEGLGVVEHDPSESTS